MGMMKEFTKGIWKENPIFRIVLGLCPTLAISTSVKNGVGMGIAATFVLVCSNIFISSLRNFIPAKIRIPAYIVIVATFVTVTDLAMNAYFHPLHKALGIFIPLIVVNCIILGRAEAFANKNGVLASMFDGLGMGAGFTCALLVLGTIREILGNGTFWGMPVFSASYQPFLIMILPPGAFILLGSLLGIMNRIEVWQARKAGRTPSFRKEHDCATCTIYGDWFNLGRTRKAVEASKESATAS